jgi:hypothetical protein
MIQLIEKQGFCMEIYGTRCSYIPVELWTDGIVPLKKIAKGTTIGWYVKRKFVSVFQIHKAIRNVKTS